MSNNNSRIRLAVRRWMCHSLLCKTPAGNRDSRGLGLLLLCCLFAGACTGLFLDETPPRVIACVPADAAQQVGRNTGVSLTFSEAMDRETVERAFSLTSAGGDTVAGVFHWEQDTLFFTPLQALPVSPGYYVQLETAAEDSQGNNLATRFVSAFSLLGSGPKPEVVWTTPADGSHTPAGTQALLVAFSRPMDPVSFQAAFSISPLVEGMVSALSNGSVLRFTPTTPLVHGTMYTVRVSAAACDTNGNGLSAEYGFGFTVGTDFTAPALVSFATQGGVPLIPTAAVITNISKTSSVQLIFSEEMDPESTRAAFSLSPDAGGRISVVSNLLTFIPDSALAPETVYTLRLATGAQDLQGNRLAAECHILFRTDAPDSRYLRVLAVRGETNEAWTQNITVPVTDQRLTNLSIEFSAPVGYLSVVPHFSITFYSGDNPASAGSLGEVSFEPNNRVMRFGLNDLDTGNIYKLTITSEGTDIHDNPLAEDWVFFFQT